MLQRIKSPRIAAFLVLLLSVCAFLPGLGSFGLIDPSDGLYPEGAREMIESQNYLLPYVNYQPFYEKPILIYWLIAACFKLFGVSELAARLPAALSSIGCCMMVYLGSRKQFGKRAAFLSTLVLLSNFLFITIGHLALTDAPLTFLSTSSFLAFFQYLRNKNTRTLFFAFACLAFSLLLKGPVLLVLVGLTLILYKALLNRICHSERQLGWTSFIRLLRPLQGSLVILVLCLPWFLAAHIATNGAFTQEFFIRQNFGRALGHVNHREPFWFYIPYLCGSFFLWLFSIPCLIPIWRKLFRPRQSLTERTKLALYCCSWLVSTAVVFLAVPTKLPPYILPAIPPASLLIGFAIDEAVRTVKRGRSVQLVLASTSALTGTLLAVALILCRTRLEECGLVPLALSGLSALSMTAAGGLSLLYLLQKRNSVWCGLEATVIGIYLSIALIVPSALLFFYVDKDRELETAVKAGANANLATFWRDTTTGVFYHHKKVQLIMSVEDMSKYLSSPQKPHLIICTRDLIPFLQLEAKKARLHIVQDGRHFALYDLDR